MEEPTRDEVIDNEVYKEVEKDDRVSFLWSVVACVFGAMLLFFLTYHTGRWLLSDDAAEVAQTQEVRETVKIAEGVSVSRSVFGWQFSTTFQGYMITATNDGMLMHNRHDTKEYFRFDQERDCKQGRALAVRFSEGEQLSQCEPFGVFHHAQPVIE